MSGRRRYLWRYLWPLETVQCRILRPSHVARAGCSVSERTTTSDLACRPARAPVDDARTPGAHVVTATKARFFPIVDFPAPHPAWGESDAPLLPRALRMMNIALSDKADELGLGVGTKWRAVWASCDQNGVGFLVTDTRQFLKALVEDSPRQDLRAAIRQRLCSGAVTWHDIREIRSEVPFSTGEHRLRTAHL